MEIEMAIEEFKMENALLGVRNPMKVARNELAISALREQQEREKGCEMCKGRDALLLRKAHKYCHYCGRPLKEAQKDDK